MSRKHELLAKQVEQSCTMQEGAPVADEPSTHVEQLSPEFYDLIRGWDPEAENDEYYVTSSDFIELHTRIRRFLIRRLIWWATSVCLGMSVLFIIYM